MYFAVLLGFFVINDFFSVDWTTFLQISHDETQTLHMHIDISFPNMPCSAIDIQAYDQNQYKQNLLASLKYFDISPNGVYESNKFHEFTAVQELVQRIKKDIQDKINSRYGCQLNGTLQLPKSPTTLIFKPTYFRNSILSLPQETQKKARMNYKLNLLQFGSLDNYFEFPISHKSKHIENYINDLESSIKNRKYVQDFTNQITRQDYLSHIKIIPIVLQLQDKKVPLQKFKYSIRSSTAPINEDPYEGVMFMTQIQPINIIYKRKPYRIYSLAIRLFAIVGGTMATIGLFNTLGHYIFKIR